MNEGIYEVANLVGGDMAPNLLFSLSLVLHVSSGGTFPIVCYLNFWKARSMINVTERNYSL